MSDSYKGGMAAKYRKQAVKTTDKRKIQSEPEPEQEEPTFSRAGYYTARAHPIMHRIKYFILCLIVVILILMAAMTIVNYLDPMKASAIIDQVKNLIHI